MICGLTLFVRSVSLTEKNFLEFKLNFKAAFSARDWDEVGFGDSENSNVIWREASFKSMIVRLGCRTEVNTGKPIWLLKIRGSIHKYYRNGINSDQFTVWQAVDAIDRFCEELRIKKERFTVTRLEIGVNIPLQDMTAGRFVNTQLLRYKKYWFKDFKEEKVIGKEVRLSHYRFKVYAKDKKILRLELKWTDMQELRENGFNIRRLSHLTKESISAIASKKLLKAIENIVTLNGIILEERYFPKGMSKRNEEILRNYASETHIKHIADLLSQTINTNKTEYNRISRKDQRHRDKYESLVEAYGTGIQKEILAKARLAIQINCVGFLK